MSTFGGDGSDTSGVSPNMDDASLGDAITGGDGSFGATGGSDLGTILSSVGQAFAGGGSPVTNSPAATVNAIQQATDPTGTIGAQTAIAGGQGAPEQGQNQNPQGPQGSQSGQGGNQDQFAPPAAVDALKKAIQGLRQQQRQNPYAFPNSNSPMLNRAARIPASAVPDKPAEPDDPNAPSQYASNMEFMNDNPPPQSGIDFPAAVQAGLRTNAPDTSGQFKVPPAANENAPSENFPAFLKNLRGGAGAPPVQPQTDTSAPPTLDLGAAQDQGGLGGLAALARLLGLGPAGLGAAIAMKPTPAETGELTPGQVGMNYRPEDDPQAPKAPQLHKSEVLREGEGGPATTTAPVTGKKIETVDPKTKKPVNPKTGQPLPTKKGPLPTKTGHYEPTTGDARDKTWHPDGISPMMRDVSGVSTGVPQGLGELAKMAMPLLMMAMGGMGGGGRRGGHWHGGRGMWPYHHPNFGWGMHGFHPGGGWRPMHPVHFREMGGGGGGPLGFAGGGQGGTGNPALEQILQGLGINTGNQQSGGNQGQSGFGRPQGGGLNWSPPSTQGPWSANPFLNTVVGAESTGRNSGAPGQGPGGDGGIARGYYNIQTPTWGEFTRGVPGASQYPTADAAPPEVQQAVAMTIPAARFGDRTRAILHQQFGNFDERMTLGQLADQFGGTAWANRGKTSTGGSKSPNPDGNDMTVPVPRTTQAGPEGVANAG